MALQHLTDEQVASWTREQKDHWWFQNVFRGDMPQLTIRSAVTGFLLGGILSGTNLYIGAKTGIGLGVGLTSVILAFAMFKVLSAMRVAKDFTILENNAMQSIATSAGYMTMPLTSCIAAYMWKADKVMPWHQVMFWNVITSLMGVLVAFPMKRRFINDEQQPFPEGRACGVVLDALYSGHEGKQGGAGGVSGLFQAKAMVVAGVVTALFEIAKGEAIMKLAWLHGLGQKAYWVLNEQLDSWFFRLVKENHWGVPSIFGVDIRELSLRPKLDIAMFGTGGLMGVRITTSMIIGAVVNFAIVAPWMIHVGEIKGTVDAAGVEHFGRALIVNKWSIWWGVGIMVVGSLVALFAKPKLLIDPFRALFSRKKQAGEDVLANIELPFKWSFIGLPILAVITAWMAHEWYGMSYWLTLACLPLVFALSLICTNAMALTSWTPTGALSKITQFTFGMIDNKHAATNLMTAGITSSVAANAANLLSDIKPGYMLGAKPRQQAVGHVIGIFAGALASTPLFYLLFLSGYDPKGTVSVQNTMATDKFGFPGALQWKGVADIIEGGFHNLPTSIIWSLVIASLVAVVFEVLRITTKNKFPLSPVSIGLGVVLPFDATLAMWVGSLCFMGLHKFYSKREGTIGNTLWVKSLEPICAGIIAGAALTGIGDKLIEVFVLPRFGGG